MKIYIIIILFISFLINYLRKKYDVYEWNSCKLENIKKTTRTLEKYGVVIINDFLSPIQCNNIIDKINQIPKKNRTLGNINSPVNRMDLLIPLRLVKKYISSIISKTKYLWNTITPSHQIVECSSLISFPGATAQVWHSDSQGGYSRNEANLISVGVALHDITQDMGPLECYLESNSIYNYDVDKLIQKYNIKPEKIRSNVKAGKHYQSLAALCNKLKFKHVKCVCKKGSLILWSSQVIHRGGPNISTKIRPVFYFSLLGNGIRPIGPTYSLSTS